MGPQRGLLSLFSLTNSMFVASFYSFYLCLTPYLVKVFICNMKLENKILNLNFSVSGSYRTGRIFVAALY